MGYWLIGMCDRCKSEHERVRKCMPDPTQEAKEAYENYHLHIESVHRDQAAQRRAVDAVEEVCAHIASCTPGFIAPPRHQCASIARHVIDSYQGDLEPTAAEVAEREACARIADERAEWARKMYGSNYRAAMADHIAKAIRERGEPPSIRRERAAE